MNKMMMRALLALIAGLGLGWTADADGTWNGGTSTNWSTNGNWTPSGDPNSDNSSATFTGSPANQPAMDANRTVKLLNFNTTTPITISGASTLTMQAAAGSAEIVLLSGAHTIACPVALASATTIQVDAGCQLTITGAISGSGTLTKTGSGTLILSVANSYTGATTISAGSVRLGNGTALGGTGAGTTVDPNGALVLTSGITLAAEALTLNGTLSFDSASACTIPAGLTCAGSAPAIESLQGSHTIAGNLVVNASLSVFVANGSTLTLSDADITGTGLLSKYGSGVLNKETTAPADPAFTAPAATTNDTTPTWSWTGSGGTYRYTLDGGGTGTTTATGFTPGAPLGNGSHTLVIAERDAAGNWSGNASRSVTVVESTPPQILSARTEKNGGNTGRINRVRVTFSEPMAAVSATGDWAVSQGATTWVVSSTLWDSTTQLLLVLAENGADDTGAVPDLAYTPGLMTDVAGNALAGATVRASDGVAPALTAATAVSGTNAVTVRFSEPVVTANAGTGNLEGSDFAFANPPTSVQSFTDANGLDRAVELTTFDAVATGSTTIAAIAGGIYDLSGNPMGTTAVTLTTPAASKISAASGNWYTPATWVGGAVPTTTENVIIAAGHTVLIGQPGNSNVYITVASLTLQEGARLRATATPDVLGSAAQAPTTSNYTIINLGDRQIEATGTATIDEIQLYDLASGADTIIRVADGKTLTLNNTVQGHFLRSPVKQGTGTLVWNSVGNFYSGVPDGTFDDGPLRVEAGTMRLLQAGGRPSNQALTVLGSGTLELLVNYGTSNLTGQGTITSGVNGVILTMAGSSWSGRIQDGSGTIAVAASGINTWSGTSTFTGGLAVNAGGTLTVSGTKAIDDGCAVTLNGTLAVNDSEKLGALTVAANSTISVAASAVCTVTGQPSFNSPVTVQGGGTLALTGTADGADAGQITVQGGSVLSITAGQHLTGTLHLNGSTVSVESIATIASDVTITNGTGTIQVATGATVTLSGLFTGAHDFVKSGGGTLVIGQDDGLRTSTRVTGGTVRIAGDGRLGAAAAPVTLAGGTLEASAGLASTRGLTIEAPGGGVVSVATGTTLDWGGAVDGGGTLTKSGLGTLALTAANTFTGALAVQSGILRAGTVAALGAAGTGTTVADGATLDLDLAAGGTIAEPLTLGGALSMDDAQVVVLSGTMALTRVGLPVSIDVGNAGGTLTASNTVSGTSGLAKSGSGTLALTATNSFSGQVSVMAGALAVGADGGLGNAANEVLLNGGTLRATGTITSMRIVRIGSADGTIDTNGQTITLPGIDTTPGQDLTLSGAGTLAFAIPGGQIRNLGGRLGGTAALQLTDTGGGGDPGMLVIGDAANSWSGICTVVSGRLTVNGAISGNLSVQSGGLLAGNGTVGALSVASGGTVSPGGQTGGTGSAPGVLKAASAAFATGSLLRFDLGSANDLLSVTGSATFTGATSVLSVTGSPSAAAFNANTTDLVLIASAGMTYPAGAIGTVNYGGGITTQASYRVAVDGTSLLLQRNRAPTVATGVAATITPLVAAYADGTTTPPSYTVGPPGSNALFNADVDATAGTIPLVQATDPEGVAASSIVFTLKLDPGQGRIEWDADATAAQDWRTVSADTALKTWTQQDIADGRVRYLSTGSVGGTDAILYDVKDALVATSPLYLMRFTILGNGPPVIASLPAPAAVWQEPAVKPGAWGAIAPAATIADSDTPVLDGGLLQFDLLNGEAGDELAFTGDGIATGGGQVSVSGVPIGTLVAGATSLAVTLNDAASLARVQLLLRSASFRTASSAPVANGRSVSITTKDGTAGGATSVYAVTLVIDLYNDAPSLAMTVDLGGTPTASSWIAAVPGLDRTGTLTPTDPEGVGLASINLELRQSPLNGTLTWADGTGARAFTYRAGLLSQGQTADVIEDSFIIRATDVPFDDVPQQRKVGAVTDSRDAARYADYTFRVRISGGGTGLAFLNVPRMTVDDSTAPAGSFSYLPQTQRPAGSGTIVFELIDKPAGITLGSGSGQLLFVPATGAISWPAVPAPTPPYWRFGILATDLTTGSAALQPVMLRVGPGGTNG